MPFPSSGHGSTSSAPDCDPSAWLEPKFEPGLVSVIIPTFNRAAFIGEALASLEAQTWNRLEIVVVDDGSTDDTVGRLQARVPMGAGRSLRVVTQPNAGVSAARNTGTRAATGEFIVYLDSDDLLFPEAITRYVEALRTHDAGYCFAPIDSVDEAGRLTNDHRRFYPRIHSADHLFDCFWLVHGACYRRRVLSAAGPWNPALRRNEDHELLWRIKTSSGPGYHLDVVQGTYRQHSRDQLHQQLDWVRFFETRLESIDVFVGWLREHNRLDREMRLRVARQCRFLSTRLAILGRREAKNRALQRVGQLCEGVWHPLRLCVGLKYVNVRWPFELVARARYEWHRRRGSRGRSASLPASSRPELLFVSPIFPDAEGTGPARRADAVITALGRRHRVTMLVVSTALHADSKPVAPDYLGGRWAHVPFKADRLLRLRQSVGRRFPWLHACLWRRPTDWNELTPARLQQARMTFDGQRFDIVHTFRLSMAPYALALRVNQPECTRYQLDLDDIESVTHGRLAGLMLQHGKRAQADSYTWKARAYARAERRLLPRFDRLFVCSGVDRTRLQSVHPDVRVLPNIVASPASVPPLPADVSSGEFRLLFVGLLNYPPNKDGLSWFCREMVPLLRASRPCSLVVGGRAMPCELQQLIDATPGVRSIGPFTTAAEGFSQGDALIVPLRAGGGTRIKILEAFAYGRPVISTAIGMEGIEAVAERDFLLADTPEAFVRQIIRLIDDPALRVTLADNARRLLVARYSPATLIDALTPA